MVRTVSLKEETPGFIPSVCVPGSGHDSIRGTKRRNAVHSAKSGVNMNRAAVQALLQNSEEPYPCFTIKPLGGGAEETIQKAAL